MNTKKDSLWELLGFSLPVAIVILSGTNFILEPIFGELLDKLSNTISNGGEHHAHHFVGETLSAGEGLYSVVAGSILYIMMIAEIISCIKLILKSKKAYTARKKANIIFALYFVCVIIIGFILNFNEVTIPHILYAILICVLGVLDYTLICEKYLKNNGRHNTEECVN